MKIQADCAPCLLKRVLFQARLDERADDFSSMEAAIKALADNFSADRTSCEVATAVHEAAYSRLPTEDPYRRLKISSDKIADQLSVRAQEFVDASDNKIRSAMLVAAVANIMDFGSNAQAIDDPGELEAMFDDLLDQGLGFYNEELISSLILGARRILYVFDNCGESELDRIFIRELRRNGKHVIGVVRGKSILNDVTMEDAEMSGLTSDLDEIVDTGKFYVGIDLADMPEPLRNAVSSCDLMIMKGMANYECVSEVPVPTPIIHILRAKCLPVANSIGVPLGTNAVFAVLNGSRM